MEAFGFLYFYSWHIFTHCLRLPQSLLKTKIFDACFFFLFFVFFAAFIIIILSFVKKNSLFKILATLPFLIQNLRIWLSKLATLSSFFSFYRNSVVSFVNETMFTLILGLFFICFNFVICLLACIFVVSLDVFRNIAEMPICTKIFY